MASDLRAKRTECEHFLADMPANSQLRAGIKSLLNVDLESAHNRLETERDADELRRLQGECRTLRQLLKTFNGTA